MDLAATATTLFTFLDENRIRYAVAGGYALIAHGIGRATFDLDLVLPSSCQELLISHLEGQGYETVYRSSGFSNHVHEAGAATPLDFIYVDIHTEGLIFNSCDTMQIFPGLTAPVPKPEHLVAMKLRAIKNDPERTLQDLSDIQRLSQLDSVDQQHIHSLFEDIELDHLYEAIKPRRS